MNIVQVSCLMDLQPSGKDKDVAEPQAGHLKL